MSNDFNNTINTTQSFNLHNHKNSETKRILKAVCSALSERGYDPITQIVGYILSEDPTYITNHNNARSLIRQLDRDELLQLIVSEYLNS